MQAIEDIGSLNLKVRILTLAGWTKKLTGIPTITVGSVGLKSDFIGLYAGDDAVESQSIDDLIKRMESDEFDMVAIGRALLSDPEWVKKVKTGDFEAIIPFEKNTHQKYIFNFLKTYLLIFCLKFFSVSAV
ncbi:MAG: hypothetical protein CM15mP22_3190 [Gammaproteobacteria bacterium]|nr:MAG: hypothetical protein CM15mP22_3190 [Gammaproteobacteria bacterium]